MDRNSLRYKELKYRSGPSNIFVEFSW